MHYLNKIKRNTFVWIFNFNYFVLIWFSFDFLLIFFSVPKSKRKMRLSYGSMKNPYRRESICNWSTVIALNHVRSPTRLARVNVRACSMHANETKRANTISFMRDPLKFHSTISAGLLAAIRVLYLSFLSNVVFVCPRNRGIAWARYLSPNSKKF